MKKVSKKIKISIVLRILFVVLIFFGVKKYVYPENLNIREWKTLTDHYSDRPFRVKYPKGWVIKPADPMKERAIYKIYSPWNTANNFYKNSVLIKIDRNTERGWGGSGDPLLSKDVAILADNNHTFTETTANGYRTLIGRQEIDGSTYAYIFTPSEIFRFELIYNTDKYPKEIIDIFHEIVKSFKLIKKTNL